MLMRYLYRWAQGQKSRDHSLSLAAFFQKPLTKGFQTRVISPLVLFFAFSDHFLTLNPFLKVPPL